MGYIKVCNVCQAHLGPDFGPLDHLDRTVALGHYTLAITRHRQGQESDSYEEMHICLDCVGNSGESLRGLLSTSKKKKDRIDEQEAPKHA